MKFTTTTFLLAMAVFAAAIALPQRVEPVRMQEEIDITGVDTVHIESMNAVNVHFGESTRAVATAAWPSDGDCRVGFRREQGTLHVDASGSRFSCLELTLPAGITRILADTLDVRTSVPLEAITVEFGTRLTWRGDVDRLVVVEDGSLRVAAAVAAQAAAGGDPAASTVAADGDPDAAAVAADEAALAGARGPDCAGDVAYCDIVVQIEDGAIADLQVDARRAGVSLGALDRFGHVTLRLAPHARFSVDNARSFDNLELIHPEATD